MQLFSNYSLAFVIFLLNIIGGAKAGSKMLMKLTPGVNFINILCVCFSYDSAFLPKEKLRQALLFKKNAHVKC
jgi:hypothetical protein